LDGYRPIPRSAKVRPAYRASNAALKLPEMEKALRRVQYAAQGFPVL